jgi:hypothetical protein
LRSVARSSQSPAGESAGNPAALRSTAIIARQRSGESGPSRRRSASISLLRNRSGAIDAVRASERRSASGERIT